MYSGLELLQKCDIWILKVAHIRDAVFDHDETVESESEGESCVFIGVDSSFAKHIWMHESCTHELDPTRAFTYLTSRSTAEWTREIYLYSWLHEWEISWTHTDRDFSTEYIREHGSKRILQVRECDIAINNHSLYLIKCVLVGCIYILITEHSPRDDCLDGSSFGFHEDILHARCLGGEHISCSLKPECILHITGWMGFRDIERVEIPVLGCHFARLVTIESHTFETVLDLHEGSCNRMEMIEGILYNRSRHILEFVRETAGNEVVLNNHELRFKSLSHTDLTFIDGFSDGFLVLIREVFYSFEKFSQRPVFSENSITEIDESSFGGERRYLGEGGCFECLEVLEHDVNLNVRVY